MRVAVLIVNYNSGQLLDRCLRTVHEQSRQPDRVVVVDNNSSDESLVDFDTRWPDVQLIRMTSNVGFAAANNRGLEACGDCDWVALLNPDAFPEPEWIAALLDAVNRKPEAGSFASCLVKAENDKIMDGMGDAYHVSGLVWRIGHGKQRPVKSEMIEVFSACAAAALYRYDSIKAAGGFDESYFCYNEDVDLGFRLRLRGLSCWYVPEAVVRHVGSAVTGEHSDFSLFFGHRNLVWTYVKNMPGPLLASYLWQHLLLNIVSILWLSIRYRTTALFRAKYSAVKGLRKVWRQRRKIQAGRLCNNGEILSVMTRGWWRCYSRHRFGG